MREDILSGRLPPGAPLTSDAALAERFAVSRTVVREAMRSLRALGLVEVSQGRRPRVARVDARSAAESLDAMFRRGAASMLSLLEVRRPLEVKIAALAAERAGKQHLADLARTIDTRREMRSFDACVDADVLFHRTLGASTGNELFPLLLDALNGPLHESRRRTLARSGVEIAIEGHAKILAAVGLHDSDAAGASMTEHLTLAERDLRAADPLLEQTPRAGAGANDDAST